MTVDNFTALYPTNEGTVEFKVDREGNHFVADGMLYDVPIVARARSIADLRDALAAQIRAAWRIANSEGEPECAVVGLTFGVWRGR